MGKIHGVMGTIAALELLHSLSVVGNHDLNETGSGLQDSVLVEVEVPPTAQDTFQEAGAGEWTCRKAKHQ